MILVLGGTSEARQLLDLLAYKDWPVVVSTAYALAERFIPKHPNVQHIHGKLDAEKLQALITDRKIRVVVDVTHPYAVEISKNAQVACKNTAINYIRLERDVHGECDVENIFWAESYEEAVSLACNLGEVIFLATGSSNVKIPRNNPSIKDKRFFIRVLPDKRSMDKCIEAGFMEEEIITGIGPFSYDNNYQLWQELQVDVLITKDSGLAGGFLEKINAAKDLGMRVIVIERPKFEVGESGDFEVLRSIDSVIHAIRQLLGDGSEKLNNS